MGLFDLGYVGPKFTWKGKKTSTDYVQARLDRGLIFTHFSQICPSCRTLESPALVICLASDFNSNNHRKSSPRCFEPHWIKDEDCLDFFYKLWLLDPAPSTDVVRSNVNSILDHILEWSKKKHGNLALNIKRVRQKLDSLRSKSWIGQLMRKQI